MDGNRKVGTRTIFKQDMAVETELMLPFSVLSLRYVLPAISAYCSKEEHCHQFTDQTVIDEGGSGRLQPHYSFYQHWFIQVLANICSVQRTSNNLSTQPPQTFGQLSHHNIKTLPLLIKSIRLRGRRSLIPPSA